MNTLIQLNNEELMMVDGGINWGNVATCTATFTAGGMIGGSFIPGIGTVAGGLLAAHYGAAACISGEAFGN